MAITPVTHMVQMIAITIVDLVEVKLGEGEDVLEVDEVGV